MLAITIILVAIVTGSLIALHTRRNSTNRSLSWVWPYFLIIAFFAIKAAYRWEARSDSNLIMTNAGLALIGCAVVSLAHVIWLGSTLTRSRLARLGRAALGLVIAVILLSLGHSLRMLPRAMTEGWWAAMPSTILIECVPWLPQEAITHDRPPRAWNLQARRTDLWRWQESRLRSRLRDRYVADPSLVTFLDYCMADRADAQAHRATAIWFGALTNQFLGGSEPQRRDASDTLRNFLPTQWKIAHPEVGAIHGRAVLSGRLDRLIELARDSGSGGAWTAIDLIATCGDDAMPAIPVLFEIARAERWRRSMSASALNYLAHTSPLVRARLIQIADAGHAFDRILAIECLSQWNWSHPDARACLETIVAGDDPVLSAFASRNLVAPSTDRHLDIVDAVLDAVELAHPDRADYLLSLGSEYEHLSIHIRRLIAALSDPDSDVRAAACILIQSVSWRDCPDMALIARSEIEPLLTERDAVVAEAARDAIDDINEWLSRAAAAPR
jgi:hypothetical protein